MLTLFLICFSLLQFASTSTPLLQYTDFASGTFSSPNDWFVAFGNLGYQTVNSQSIFGGINNFGVSTQIQKVFVLPPHYLIRVLITIWTFGQWNNGEIKLLCEERVMSSKKLYTMQNDQHRSPTMSNVILYHNAATAIISIRPSIQDQYTQSWGIRDFQIYYYPCPNGCQICSDTDKQTSDCNQWIVGYSQFTTNSIDKIHNEGWFINDDKINFTFEKCNGLTLFGYYNAGQILKRTFFLDAHDRIRIQFLLIKVNDWDKSVLQLLIDGFSQYQYQDKTDQLHNINYCDSNTGLDSIERIDLQFDHSKQLTEFIFQSTLSQQQLQNKFGIRDFTIYISCKNCQTSQINFETTPMTYLIQPEFISSANWKAQKYEDTARLFNCSNSGINTILGRFGQGEHIKRQFTLTPHRHVRFSIQLWLIDSWDHETVFVLVDNSQIFTWTKGPYDGDNLCYNSVFGDQIFDLYHDDSHDAKTITIDIYTTLDEAIDNESFGVKNLKIELGDCPFFCSFCNFVSNDQCEFKFWVEYYSLQGAQFKDGGGWGGAYTAIPSTIQSNQCSNGLSILGGFGSIKHQGFIQYDQTIMPHSRLRIIFNLYVIGNWQNDIIDITVNADENILYSKNIANSNTQLFCSPSNVKTYIIHIDKTINHTQTQVVINITNHLPLFPEDDRSFGIRDIQIYYELL